MKMAIRTTLLVSLFALLSACSDPTLDSTTEESQEASVETLKASLNESELKQFEHDIDLIAGGVHDDMGGMEINNQRDLEKFNEAFMKTVHGKTASDIHKMANKYRED